MDSSVETLARQLGMLVRRVRDLHSTVVSGLGLRVELAGVAVLSLLAERGPSRPSALAEALHVDLSTTSRQLSALEREGWLVRERDPDDQRAQLVDLSPTGAEVLQRVRAASVEHLARLLPDWSAADLDAFAAHLARFTDDISGSRPALATTAQESR